jgi:hypothetical protein
MSTFLYHLIDSQLNSSCPHETFHGVQEVQQKRKCNQLNWIELSVGILYGNPSEICVISLIGLKGCIVQSSSSFT